jgi:hypothetical protein
MSGDQDHGAAVNDWVNVVRRAELGSTVKLVALMIATYADPDGTHVFPGVPRLAVQCDIDYRTARRAMAALREKGFLQVTRRGARRSGKSDEYRLILAADLLERCDVATPAAERLKIERVSERERTRGAKGRSIGHHRPIEPVENPGSGAIPKDGHRSPVPYVNGSTGQAAHVLQVTPTPPPSIDLYLEKQPPSDEAARRTPRTGSGIAS